MDDVEVTHVEVTDVPEPGAGAIVLDVREPDEWQRGHIAGAQHIPLAQLPVRFDEIDADPPLYVICHAGGRSLKAAQYLARVGYEPINVNGGMLSWVAAGRPVVTEGSPEDTVPDAAQAP